jgi:hypothetical protein
LAIPCCLDRSYGREIANVTKIRRYLQLKKIEKLNRRNHAIQTVSKFKNSIRTIDKGSIPIYTDEKEKIKHGRNTALYRLWQGTRLHCIIRWL